MQKNLSDIDGYLYTSKNILELNSDIDKEVLAAIHIERARIFNSKEAVDQSGIEVLSAFSKLAKSKNHELLAAAYIEKANNKILGKLFFAAEDAIDNALYHYSKYEAPSIKIANAKSTLSDILIKQGKYKEANKILEEACYEIYRDKGYKFKDTQKCAVLNQR